MKRKNGGILGFVYYLKIKFFRIVVNIVIKFIQLFGKYSEVFF